MKKYQKSNKGITLVALVITIIILLILAGISISSLTGSGLFQKADVAKKETEISQIIEEARTKILEMQVENHGEITTEEVNNIIAKYDKDYKENEEFTFQKDENGEEYIVTKKEYEILVKDIWNNKVEKESINFVIYSNFGVYTLTAYKGDRWINLFEAILSDSIEEPDDFIGEPLHIELIQAFYDNRDNNKLVNNGQIFCYLPGMASGAYIYYENSDDTEKHVCYEDEIINDRVYYMYAS